MAWIRDRSGRSGRRRGSQNPGTTTGCGDVAPVCAIAGTAPPVKAGNSAKTTINRATVQGNDLR